MIRVDNYIWIMLSEIMVNMGYTRKEIEDALYQEKYNDITSTYFLLGTKGSDVSKCSLFFCCFYLFILASLYLALTFLCIQHSEQLKMALVTIFGSSCVACSATVCKLTCNLFYAQAICLIDDFCCPTHVADEVDSAVSKPHFHFCTVVNWYGLVYVHQPWVCREKFFYLANQLKILKWTNCLREVEAARSYYVHGQFSGGIILVPLTRVLNVVDGT